MEVKYFTFLFFFSLYIKLLTCLNCYECVDCKDDKVVNCEKEETDFGPGALCSVSIIRVLKWTFSRLTYLTPTFY